MAMARNLVCRDHGFRSATGRFSVVEAATWPIPLQTLHGIIKNMASKTLPVPLHHKHPELVGNEIARNFSSKDKGE